MLVLSELVEYPCEDLLSLVQEIFLMISKNSRFHLIVSQRSVFKHLRSTEVVGWPIMNSPTVLPNLYYVCALVGVPFVTISTLEMDVFEIPKSPCSFSAVIEHGLALDISMAHHKKLVQKFNGNKNRRTATKKTRDVFNHVAKELFGHAKRVRVNSSALAQNDANFNESTLTADKNAHTEQLCYDGHGDGLSLLKASSVKDEVLNFLCIQIVELERFLPSSNLKEFHQKLL